MSTPFPPRSFGPYTAVRRVGGGGFAEAFLATDAFGATFVVKVLDPQPGNTTRAHQWFRRELEALQKVESRNLPQLHDWNLEDDPPWIAFRVAGTQTLKEGMDDDDSPARFQVARAGALLGAARGLAALHAAGMTHRDVTPDNIVLTPTDGVLLDLGLATHGEGTSYSRVLAGKLAYLAPEQWLSATSDPASDIWQWAMTAAKALGGRLPIPPGRDAPEQRRLTLEENPDVGYVPEYYRELVLRCLARDPEARPTALQVVEELELLVETDRADRVQVLISDDVVLTLVDHTYHTRPNGWVESTPICVDLDPDVVHVMWGRSPMSRLSWEPPKGVMAGDQVAACVASVFCTVVGPLVALRTGAEEPLSPCPTHCPACGFELEGQMLICRNEQHCPAQVAGRMNAFLGGPTWSRFSWPGTLMTEARVGILMARGAVDAADLIAASDADWAAALADLPTPERDQAVNYVKSELLRALERSYPDNLLMLGCRLPPNVRQEVCRVFPSVWRLLDASAEDMGDAGLDTRFVRNVRNWQRHFEPGWRHVELRRLEAAGLRLATNDDDEPSRQ